MTAAMDKKRTAALALVEAGVDKTTTARRVGVSVGTVRAWTNPDEAARQRAQSREAKARRQGVCAGCGGPTRYAGETGKAVSLRCVSCENARRREGVRWTAERVVDAIQRYAAEHGHPPAAKTWDRANKEHDYPSKSQVYRRASRDYQPFPSWADAIEAAGFPRPATGRRRSDYVQRI